MAKGMMRTIPASFVRGAIAHGMVAALMDKRQGPDLLKSALVGGAALSTAVTVEDLIFNKGLGSMGKKARKQRKKDLKNGQFPGAAAPRGWAGNGWGGTGLLAGLTANQQLLLGLVLGAGGAWLLSDEKARAKLLKAGMKLYSGMASGFEEIKEQMADMQAEMAAEQASGQAPAA